MNHRFSSTGWLPYGILIFAAIGEKTAGNLHADGFLAVSFFREVIAEFTFF
jgi:hypothetical protein